MVLNVIIWLLLYCIIFTMMGYLIYIVLDVRFYHENIEVRLILNGIVLLIVALMTAIFTIVTYNANINDWLALINQYGSNLK